MFCGYKLYPGGIWRDEYLLIDFEAFQETRVGLHIADHDTKEIYVPGTAHGDKELPSFPVRNGAICSLGNDGLTVRTPLDASDDIPWADDILSAADVADGFNPADNVDVPDGASTRVLPEETYYLEVR